MEATRDARRLEREVLAELHTFLLDLKGTRSLGAVRAQASLERDLGLGSLERVELLSRLERRFHTKVAETSLSDVETASDLVTAILNSGDGSENGFRLDAVDSFRPSELAPPEQAVTLTEVLRRRAAAEPSMPHIFLKEDGKPERTITIGELHHDAVAVAGALSHAGIGEGDAVALMLPTSAEFFSAFMGILYAGGVPVPLYPPFRLDRIQEYVERQSGILRNAEARLFVTVEQGLSVGAVLKARVPSLRVVRTVPQLRDLSQRIELPDASDGSRPALVQYTSGSTGDPKGVLLSHRNLLANVRAIGHTLAIGPSDVGVSWLPLYHDMGLIGAWLTPLYFGIPVAIFSPVAFLTRPESWLWTIHRRRGTISPAPNFAYEMCRRRVSAEDLEGLDLGSWRVALNGAEPILPDTLDGFADRFAPCGFRRESFLAVYGLAEGSLLLTASERDAGVRVESIDRVSFETQGLARKASVSEKGADPLRFVSVGKVVPGHEIRIVDAGGGDVPERQEGRLWFRGPSVTAGYYHNEAATQAIRRGHGWMDSGDRAFIAEGELFITGRDKDLIIRGGRNVVPQELEACTEEIEGVRRGCVAAFGVADADSGTEQIVIVAETRATDAAKRESLEHAVQARLMDATGFAPDEILLVAPQSVPKTSSGKVRRSACRELYLSGQLGRKRKSSYGLWSLLALHAMFGKFRDVASALGRRLYGYYMVLLSGILVLAGWLVMAPLPHRGFHQFWVRGAARLFLFLAGTRFTKRGDLDLSHAPYVVISNHASYLDAVPLMAALPFDYAFVVKEEAARWPIVRTFIKRLGHLPVSRDGAEASAQSTAAMQALLAEGRSVVVFPEATFSYAAGIRPFKLGAFKLASDSRRPLLPLSLLGTRRWLRDKTWMPRPSRLELIFGTPRYVGDTFNEAVQAREEMAEAIAEQVAEPRLDLITAGFAPRGEPAAPVS